MDDFFTHMSQNLWEHTDSQITLNKMTLSSYFKYCEYQSEPLSLQLNIVNKKSNIKMNFSINHQHITLFLAKFKVLNDSMKEIKELVEKDGSKSFQIDDFRKLVVTFLNRAEYGGLCTRISIGEKHADIQNSEVVFLSYTGFLSLIKIFTDYRDSYLQLNQGLMNTVILNKLSDKIESISNKITNYFATYQSLSVDEIDVDPLISSASSDTIINNIPEVITESSSSDDSIHNDLNSFIEVNRDSFELASFESFKKPLPDRTDATVIKNKFVEDFLENDITKLEMYLLNSANDLNPVYKFFEVVNKKTKSNYYNVESFQKISCQYIMSSYIHFMLKRHLDQKIELPKSVPLMRYDEYPANSDDIDMMYDMYLFMVYYSLLRTRLREKDRNTTNNKEMVCFLLKSICSPILFTHIKNINMEVFISEILNRFNKYTQSGVFTKLETGIKDHYQILPSITYDVIKIELTRTYPLIVQNYDKITIKNMFDSCKSLGVVNFSYEDFKSYNISQEQILKLLVLEMNFIKNKKINLDEVRSVSGIKDFTDLPDRLIKFFNISDKKSDNSNLIRYTNDTFKDDKNLDKYIELCKLVGDSYYSLKGKTIDFSQYPEQLLKSIYMWDTVADIKITNNYMYYVEKINNSSLDLSMVMSILNNLNDRVSSDFVNSFIATNVNGDN